MNQATAVILQARIGSSRFPKKVISELSCRPMILFQLERIKRCKKVNEIILATTSKVEDDILFDIGIKNGVKVFRGSENDVLSRYCGAATHTKAEIIIRLTGDCPLIDPQMIDNAIEIFKKGNYDYISNCNPPSFPDGLDLEIFTKQVLFNTHKKNLDNFSREHVTPEMRKDINLKIKNIENSEDLSNFRWTVDEPEDLLVIKSIVSHFDGSSNFAWSDVLKLHDSKPELFVKNKMFVRNEGSQLEKGQKLWRRAKRVIPGGNMLLSKRPEMFLPEKWPAYFSKAKGCKIWDLEGHEYIDMSIMGIGTNILGYGNEEVDAAVREIVNKGNMSTFNCPEEVYLAEKLISLHTWADMVRFARTGGEVNAIAIRIARAATGKDTIAICGYHGWHDWYLATNLKDRSGLEEHLLPGLDPLGVPKSLSGTVKPFSFNRLDQLEEIANKNELAAVKMEVQRNFEPKEEFLEGIRKLCDRKNIVLIFDECTSGFRETFGGIHKKYKVDPDLALFGKALGNGYACTACIGKKEIMNFAQNTFISSTFWTERIGSTASLKTLEIMERIKSWEIITKKGLSLRSEILALSKKHSLEINFNGIPSLGSYSFKSKNSNKYKTYITQEMLKNNYLASTTCYLSTSHSDSILKEYIYILDEIFSTISKCEDGMSIDQILESPPAHTGFRRLN